MWIQHVQNNSLWQTKFNSYLKWIVDLRWKGKYIHFLLKVMRHHVTWISERNIICKIHLYLHPCYFMSLNHFTIKHSFNKRSTVRTLYYIIIEEYSFTITCQSLDPLKVSSPWSLWESLNNLEPKQKSTSGFLLRCSVTTSRPIQKKLN